MSNAICPCCSSTLLRHIRPAGIYWYCSHCHQEMPNLSQSFRLKTQAKVSLSLVGEPSNSSRNCPSLIDQKNRMKIANSA